MLRQEARGLQPLASSESKLVTPKCQGETMRAKWVVSSAQAAPPTQDRDQDHRLLGRPGRGRWAAQTSSRRWGGGLGGLSDPTQRVAKGGGQERRPNF